MNVFTIAYYIIFKSKRFKKIVHEIRFFSICVAWSLSLMTVFFFTYFMNSCFSALVNSFFCTDIHGCYFFGMHKLYCIHPDITLLERLASGWSLDSYVSLLNVDPIDMRHLGMYVHNILMQFSNYN